MLFDASRNGVKNDTARLVSPTETISSGKSCLEFYYNAYGKNKNKKYKMNNNFLFLIVFFSKSNINKIKKKRYQCWHT
jgi:archaellum biogenesis protein FlaJ (TadC family)